MDYDTPDYLIPGAAYDFHDVTQLFEEAASEMQPGDMFFMEGFVLQDAMSAFEIGEPRLDTGLTIPEQNRTPFDPLLPMLPEEICWIIDKSFAYEMEWHAGNFLCHTVFTCLYVHHLAEIDPDIIPYEVHLQEDPRRPMELITIVLRFTIQGLLKCCDLAWRELSKNGVQDSEDWQSDKCEVSLLEGVPVEHVLSGLDDAIFWLTNSMQVESPWKEALLARVRFRKVFLQVMNSDIFRDQSAFQNLLNQAQVQLRSLIAMPALEFSPNTPPHLAFDPYIGRRLNSFVPIRVLTLPGMPDTWKTFSDFFDGLYEISLLSVTKNLSTWKCVGNFRLWLSDPPLRSAYLRSRTQSTFYDGLLILGKYTFSWMVDQFFFETAGITYNSISNLIKDTWTKEEPPPLNKLERILYKLITPHIRALWYNPPRRRRHYMKSLLEWHKLYDAFVDITTPLSQEDFRENPILRQLPRLALVWSLPSMREVVLSGFQLELYSKEEKPVAYWFAAGIIDAQLTCYDELILVIPKDSKAYHEVLYQQQWLTALQSMCTAMFVITMPFTSYDWDRIRPNFYRRYKWAFRPEYDKIATLVLVQPRLLNVMQTCLVILDRDDVMSPSGLIDFAHTLLLDLSRSENFGGWAGKWEKERKAMIQNLLSVCEALHGLPTIFDPREGFNIAALKWDPAVHPWFPTYIDTM